jgi:hypothetical protein
MNIQPPPLPGPSGWETRDDIPQEILDGAQNGLDWYDAYRQAGFDHEDAMRLLTRVIVTVNTPAYEMPPEMSEFYSRISALVNKTIAED